MDVGRAAVNGGLKDTWHLLSGEPFPRIRRQGALFKRKHQGGMFRYVVIQNTEGPFVRTKA